MRRKLVIAAAVATVLAGAGCRQGKQPLPSACDEAAATVVAALARAPAPVRIDGTPLSACLNEAASADDLQRVGTTFVSVAGELGDAAQRPRGRAAAELRLGYLIGAAQRGASRTAGVHAELLRRLEQEATAADARSPAFRRGERAGRSAG